MAEKEKYRNRQVENLGVKTLIGVMLLIIGVCTFCVYVVYGLKTDTEATSHMFGLILGVIPAVIGFYLLTGSISVLCQTVEKLDREAEELKKLREEIRWGK